MGDVVYKAHDVITPDEFVEILTTSTLGERRLIDNRECIHGMVEHADLVVTARDGDKLVGVARSVTDFTYCCYMSDLAVEVAYQRKGIGKRLIDLTVEQLGPECMLILLSAPGAVDYYPHVGFERHDQCWIIRPESRR
jgi:predicted N-acetyltransferase YhbS